MEQFTTNESVTKAVAHLRKSGKSIGFVPTMGALHEGHLSLIKHSKSQNDITVVSVFVNPTQFNDKEDLRKYPRPIEDDLLMLHKAGTDMVFTPDEIEMYPEPDTRKFDFGKLELVMEGKFRSGHFNGVAQIVSKLFDIVRPTRSYFGQKDFQQLTIVKALVNKYMPESGIEIVSCPIIREPDGLAMSSRNKLLTDLHRASAPLISQTLFKAIQLSNKLTVSALKAWVIEQINANPNLSVEYFEVVDTEALQPVDTWSDAPKTVGCVAVFAGKVRLIDNVVF